MQAITSPRNESLGREAGRNRFTPQSGSSLMLPSAINTTAYRLARQPPSSPAMRRKQYSVERESSATHTTVKGLASVMLVSRSS